MAEVFISYSRQVSEPTLELATELGGHGIGCWYDAGLQPNNVFWKVIMKQITEARAVVVIWSPPALESEWVYGEAMLAHQQKKLICARTEDVDPSAVPLPFNGYNVTLVKQRAPILKALESYGVQRVAPAPAEPAAAEPAAPMSKQASEAKAHEIAVAWDMIKSSEDPDDLTEFLASYGVFDHFIVKQAAKRAAKAKPITVVTTEDRGEADRQDMAAAEANVVLRVDPGMHTSTVRRFAVSRDQTRLATISDDKTCRLWRVPALALERTFRVEIGPGNVGRLQAVAMEADASKIYVAGWGSNVDDERDTFVSVLNAATGEMLERLGPLPSAVNELRLSPDGLRLVVGLGTRSGMRSWRRDGVGEPWRDDEMDTDYEAPIFGLAFASDGRMAMTAFDTRLRLYGPKTELLGSIETPGGRRPQGVAFSPDGKKIAVGHIDAPLIDIFDAVTLAPIGSLRASEKNRGNLAALAWTEDGQSLAAAGMWPDNSERLAMVPLAGGEPKSVALPQGKAMSIENAPGRGLWFAGEGPQVGLFTPDAQVRQLHGLPRVDMRGKVRENFLVSGDGARVRMGFERGGETPVMFDLARLALTEAPVAAADLHAADTDSLKINGWEDTRAAVLVRKGERRPTQEKLRLFKHERVRSLAVGPGAGWFVLGAEWSLRRFDAVGQQQWRQNVPGACCGVNLAREGRLLVAGYDDGTIRWHDAASGEEKLALFLYRPDGAGARKEWVLWTPRGYYIASPGGERLIGWHVNRGADKAADFFPVDTFRAAFNKPEVVSAALDGI